MVRSRRRGETRHSLNKMVETELEELSPAEAVADTPAPEGQKPKRQYKKRAFKPSAPEPDAVITDDGGCGGPSDEPCDAGCTIANCPKLPETPALPAPAVDIIAIVPAEKPKKARAFRSCPVLDAADEEEESSFTVSPVKILLVGLAAAFAAGAVFGYSLASPVKSTQG